MKIQGKEMALKIAQIRKILQTALKNLFFRRVF